MALIAGCASPGPPKPPSLKLPALATDLSAKRMGDQVFFSWTTPRETTDKLTVQGAMTAEVCREAGPRPQTPVARLAACVTVKRLPVVPGSAQITDDLPPALMIDPPVLLTYRVRLFNAKGRTAGDSVEAAYAASGAAPPAIEGLRVSSVEAGAVLEWQASAKSLAELVELDRKDLDWKAPDRKDPDRKDQDRKDQGRKPQAAGEKDRKKTGERPSGTAPTPTRTPFPAEASEVRLRTPAGAAGTVDTTVQFGQRYEYMAERVRSVTLGSHVLEVGGPPSATVLLVRRDTFPPRAPQGLVAIAGLTPNVSSQTPPGGQAISIDLSWEPNAELDLAGYLVYRQGVGADGHGEGARVKLTALPVAAPAYHDAGAEPGRSYLYEVTAVDRAGNESKPSEGARETAPAP